MRRSLCVIGGFALVLSGCAKETAPRVEQPVVPASVITIGSVATNGSILLTGVVEPVQETDVAAQIIAPVLSLSKREGDPVRRGEVVARLLAPTLSARTQQADAALKAARQDEAAAAAQSQLASATLVRYQKLRERQSVTPHELDQIKSQSDAASAQAQAASSRVAVAQAALSASHADESNTVIHAPFSGKVTHRYADPGFMASPGVPLLRIESSGEKQFEFSVSEQALGSVRVGSSLAVHLANGVTVTSSIVRVIVPSGDPVAHSFPVKCSLPDSPATLSGMTGTVSLPAQAPSNRILLQRSNILRQGGLDAVMVVGTSGKAQLRYVTLGQSDGDAVEVLSGLQAGERILRSPDLNLAGRGIEPQL